MQHNIIANIIYITGVCWLFRHHIKIKHVLYSQSKILLIKRDWETQLLLTATMISLGIATLMLHAFNTTPREFMLSCIIYAISIITLLFLYYKASHSIESINNKYRIKKIQANVKGTIYTFSNNAKRNAAWKCIPNLTNMDNEPGGIFIRKHGSKDIIFGWIKDPEKPLSKKQYTHIQADWIKISKKILNEQVENKKIVEYKNTVEIVTTKTTKNTKLKLNILKKMYANENNYPKLFTIGFVSFSLKTVALENPTKFTFYKRKNRNNYIKLWASILRTQLKNRKDWEYIYNKVPSSNKIAFLIGSAIPGSHDLWFNHLSELYDSKQMHSIKKQNVKTIIEHFEKNIDKLHYISTPDLIEFQKSNSNILEKKLKEILTKAKMDNTCDLKIINFIKKIKTSNKKLNFQKKQILKIYQDNK